MSYSFGKHEKLCSKKDIQTVFDKGEKFVSYPFFFAFYVSSDSSALPPVRVMVSVSKKKFKKAVQRNRIKRLCREAYRLNKAVLLENIKGLQGQVHLTINYIATSEMPFSEIQKGLQKALNQLSDESKKYIG